MDRGAAADVEIAANFLSAAPQVTILKLASLNLGQAGADTLAVNFPPHLQELWLDNTLLKQFPTTVASSASITMLYARLRSMDADGHE